MITRKNVAHHIDLIKTTGNQGVFEDALEWVELRLLRYCSVMEAVQDAAHVLAWENLPEVVIEEEQKVGPNSRQADSTRKGT